MKDVNPFFNENIMKGVGKEHHLQDIRKKFSVDCSNVCRTPESRLPDVFGLFSHFDGTKTASLNFMS